MKLLPLLALTATAMGDIPRAEPQQPAPATQEASHLTSGLVANLSDEECVALVNYMQQANLATLNAWQQHHDRVESYRQAEAAKAIAALPTEGLPEDFRRYMSEYCALVTRAMEKQTELQAQLHQADRDEAWDITNEISQTSQQLQNDTLALAARFSRASLLGLKWEKKAVDMAATDLLLRNDRARAYLDAHPEMATKKPGDFQLINAYLSHLCTQPRTEVTADVARRTLEHMEVLKLLDPTAEQLRSNTFYGCPMGGSYAIRLPYDSSTGYRWELAEPLAEDALVAVDWQVVPTASLKAPKPHGEARAVTPRPSTPETMVALVQMKKDGTAILHLVCTREGAPAPLLSKAMVFHIRRADDYRPLMETDPLPEPPPPAPKPEPGIASLSDEECLAIHRYLQKAYCFAMEDSARSVEQKEDVQLNVVAASALPTLLDKLPQDFYDYLTEFHNLTIRHRAKVKSQERKRTELYRSGNATSEQKKAMRKAFEELDQQQEEMEKGLKEKYPRACILMNASIQSAIRQVFNSHSSSDFYAQQFYAEHPEMKDASRKKRLAAYFRHLAAERAQQEQTYAAARRTLERLDALRIMNARAEGESIQCRYGQEGDEVTALILPSAPETGFCWALDRPLSDDSPVQVEWHQMPATKLQKLHDMGILNSAVPLSEQVSIASIRLNKAGTSKLRFICTRPGDDEPLLSVSAEIEIRAKKEDDD